LSRSGLASEGYGLIYNEIDLTACWFHSDNGHFFTGIGYGFSGSGLVLLQDLDSFGFPGFGFLRISV